MEGLFCHLQRFRLIASILKQRMHSQQYRSSPARVILLPGIVFLQIQRSSSEMINGILVQKNFVIFLTPVNAAFSMTVGVPINIIRQHKKPDCQEQKNKR